MSLRLFVGTVVASVEESPGEVAVHEDLTIGVYAASGQIAFVLDKGGRLVAPGIAPYDTAAAVNEAVQNVPEEYTTRADASRCEFFTPGFVDLHHHAPQEAFAGRGLGLPVMEWLKRLTFPSEARMRDTAKAEEEYPRVVEASLRNGTTTCVYFATLHTDASLVLARTCASLGQRAYIGKVTMDAHSPSDYSEPSSDVALAEVRRFVSEFPSASPAGLVRPILCPRFVPSCSETVLAGLGAMRRETGLLVTTHVAESVDEVEFVAAVAEEHLGETRDLVVLRNNDLLKGSVLAHAVHLTDEELQEVSDAEGGIAHCPLSNCYFGHGVLRVQHILRNYPGIRIGLATDVAGGYDPSMLSAIRHAVTSSLILTHGAADYMYPGRVREIPTADVVPLPLAHWLATVGGARVLGSRATLITPGEAWDALLVSPTAAPARFSLRQEDGFAGAFEKWLHLGDDRHLSKVWVAGRLVVGDDELQAA